jgi:hypothetical protein
MSSILKALKKLENEKALHKPGQLRIDSRILQERPTTKASNTSRFLIALILLAVGSGTTYLFLKHEGKRFVELPMPVAKQELKGEQPLSPQTKSDPMLGLPEIKSNPAPTHQSVPFITMQSNKQSVPATTTTRIIQQQEIQPVPLRPQETIQAPTATTNPITNIIQPKLTVNGIAFQEGGGENLAIINGSTVSNGSIIEGVRIEDIQKDRVKFSHGGEKFEILLNKSNR